MHVLSDTWAHRNFAGTPSLVINNTNDYFYELFPSENGWTKRKISFRHSASSPDDLDNSIYTSSLPTNSENSIMNLGHGRAGHLPDYSFIRYQYLPAWGGYEDIIKDNPSDYYHAFCQMITALKFLHGEASDFRCNQYDTETLATIKEDVTGILAKRQPDASADWKALGERLSGHTIEAFDTNKYQEEYIRATNDAKDSTFLGRFILASLAQKSMVTGEIFRSGSKLAGYSVDYVKKGFRGIKAFKKLLQEAKS